MKKTILKRVIFVIILLLQMAQGYAQAYEFECEKSENGFSWIQIDNATNVSKK